MQPSMHQNVHRVRGCMLMPLLWREKMKIAKFLLVIPLVVLAACSPGQGSSSSKGTVHLLGTWGGSEQDSFLAMVKPFEDRTGIKIQYEGTRDLNAVLTTRVTAGHPPDLAGLPGPGQMKAIWTRLSLSAP